MLTKRLILAIFCGTAGALVIGLITGQWIKGFLFCYALALLGVYVYQRRTQKKGGGQDGGSTLSS